MPALQVWLCLHVCAQGGRMFTLCMCFKSSPLISKQVEMKYGKTRAKQTRREKILFKVANKTCNKSRKKFIKKYARF